MLKNMKKIWILALAFLALPTTGARAETPGVFPHQKLRKQRRQQLHVTPEGTREPAIKAIESARSHIVGSLFYLRDFRLTESFIKAARRGVDVDLMIDRLHDTRAPWRLEKSLKVERDLKGAGVRLHKTPAPFREAHRKVLCTDGRKSFITTGNFDTASFDGNGSRDVSLSVWDKDLTQDLEAHILSDMNGAPQETQHESLISSGHREATLSLIHSAERSLGISQVDIQDVEICDALIGKAQKGVAVKLLLMPNPFGKTDKNTPNARRLMENGVEVRYMATGMYMHAKSMIVDADHTNPHAHISSCNFYPLSLNFNRELGIITQDDQALRKLYETFERDWEK